MFNINIQIVIIMNIKKLRFMIRYVIKKVIYSEYEIHPTLRKNR